MAARDRRGMLLPRSIRVGHSIAIVPKPVGTFAMRVCSLCACVRYAGVFAMRVSLSACARERRLAQQMLGGAADAIRLDSGSEFETHARRLRDFGRPAELVTLHLAVADCGKVLSIGQRSGQRRPLG